MFLADAGAIWTCSVLGLGALLLFAGIPAEVVFKYRQLEREFYEHARG